MKQIKLKYFLRSISKVPAAVPVENIINLIRLNFVRFRFNSNHYWKYSRTGLLGRFASLFYFNFEHFLFVFSLNKNKNVLGFYRKNVVDFWNLIKIEFFGCKSWKFLSSINQWSPTQHLGPISLAVLTFIGYKQTIERYIDRFYSWNF